MCIRDRHIAVATKDIVKTVTELKARGIEFLSAPPEAYYEMIPERVGSIDEDLKKLQKPLIKTELHYAKKRLTSDWFLRKILTCLLYTSRCV